MKNYYDILKVNKDATQIEIKTAYRKLAIEHHPDKGGAKEMFQDINEANDVLSNNEKRQEYDNSLNPAHNQQFTSMQDLFNNMGMGMNMNMHNAFNFQHIFNHNGFGNHAHFHFNSDSTPQQQQQPEIQQIKTQLQISLHECYIGVTKEIEISIATDCFFCTEKCKKCHGSKISQNIEHIQQGNRMFVRRSVGACGSCNGSGKEFSTNDCNYCKNNRKTGSLQKIQLYVNPGINNNQIVNIKVQKDNQIYDIFVECIVNYENYERTNDDLIYTINMQYISTFLGQIDNIILPDGSNAVIDSHDFMHTIENNKLYVSKFNGLPIYDINEKKITKYGVLYIKYNIIPLKLNVKEIKDNKTDYEKCFNKISLSN